MIKIVNGNILDSKENIICHQVNCMGVMGSGVAKVLRDKYPIIFDEYKEFCIKNEGNLLGEVNFVKVEENKFVANIFGQYKYGADRKYTDYKALEKGIKWVHDISQLYSLSSVAIPYKIGCGLAGGDWSIVINIIREYFEYSNIECIIYRLEE